MNRARRRARPGRWAARWLPAAALAWLLADQGFSHWRSQWYAGFLPPSVEVEEALYFEDSGGFREGCGLALYKLQDAALHRIRVHGLRGQAGAATGHERLVYGEWKPTPMGPADNDVERNGWLGGMSPGCSGLPADLQARIDAALAAPGSFYATGHESGVIVMPSLGWVLFSHFG